LDAGELLLFLGELPGGLELMRPTPAEAAFEREKNG
jgi:hypothetical protein